MLNHRLHLLYLLRNGLVGDVKEFTPLFEKSRDSPGDCGLT